MDKRWYFKLILQLILYDMNDAKYISAYENSV